MHEMTPDQFARCLPMFTGDQMNLARAMLKDAPVIILDEATASVDPENERQLQEAFEALTRDKTVIMIAHRLSTVRKADQILVLDDGRLAGTGTHDELLQSCPVYQEICRSQYKKEDAQ